MAIGNIDSMSHEVSDLFEKIDRISPTKRPNESPIGYQHWSDLLFVHWRMPLSALQPLIPDELSIDTYDGSAWVGLVPFHMSGVRPKWLPAVPGISSFHETNVRTYVHRQGRDPGVWFFSLDASSSLAVRVARWKWHLPYYRAIMNLNRHRNKLRYFSERLWPGDFGPGGTIEAEFDDLIGALDKNVPPGQAVPGTLEHFLAERYFLYSQKNDGTLFRGQVHHSPYPLREARLMNIDETLLKAAKIALRSSPEHAMFSKGVDVEVFKLRAVSGF